jgi:hypothetical protein
MQDVVRRYSDELRRAQGFEVQIRVGLNSGQVVVRSVGTHLRNTHYTAGAHTTHLAARMEQLATPGTVRLTGETLRLAEGYVAVRSLGPIPVKGRLQAAALRGLTRFVGRDAEIEHLRRVLGQAGAGGQVAAIVGEARVGKSRLTYEFATPSRREVSAQNRPRRRTDGTRVQRDHRAGCRGLLRGFRSRPTRLSHPGYIARRADGQGTRGGRALP